MKRLVAVFDEHLPHTIPHYFDIRDQRKETAFDQFLMDFKPTHFVHGGDAFDFSCISHWTKGKPKLREGANIHDDFALGNTLFLKQQKILEPNLEELVFITGNHEGWIDLLIEEEPNFTGFIELQNATVLPSLGCKIIPRRKLYDAGGLCFIHGDYKDGYMPRMHAEAIANLYRRDICYGHFHTEQTGVCISPVEDVKFTATCVGTMSHTRPKWRKNQADGWVNSFLVAYGDDAGNWSRYIVRVHEEHGFTFEGVQYK